MKGDGGGSTGGNSGGNSSGGNSSGGNSGGSTGNYSGAATGYGADGYGGVNAGQPGVYGGGVWGGIAATGDANSPGANFGYDPSVVREASFNSRVAPSEQDTSDYASDFSGTPDTSIAGGWAMGKALGQAMAQGSMSPAEAHAKAQEQGYNFASQTAANLGGMISGMPTSVNAALSSFSPAPLSGLMGIGASLAALSGQNAWGGGTTDPEGLGGDGSEATNTLSNTGEGNFENLLAGLQAQPQDNSVLPPTTNTYEPLVRKLKLRGRTLADLIAQGGA